MSDYAKNYFPGIEVNHAEIMHLLHLKIYRPDIGTNRNGDSGFSLNPQTLGSLDDKELIDLTNCAKLTDKGRMFVEVNLAQMLRDLENKASELTAARL